MSGHIVDGMQRQERHAEWQRQSDQCGWKLQDWCSLAPTGGYEFDRCQSREADHEYHDDVGQNEAVALDLRRQEIEQDADEGMVTATIGHRTANERQDRQ